jgi:hypothetical protein
MRTYRELFGIREFRVLFGMRAVVMHGLVVSNLAIGTVIYATDLLQLLPDVAPWGRFVILASGGALIAGAIADRWGGTSTAAAHTMTVMALLSLVTTAAIVPGLRRSAPLVAETVDA